MFRVFKRPPHCPHCLHLNFIKKGIYTIRRTGQPVCRYRCQMCGSGFSSRTFSFTYRQKRPDLNGPVFSLLTRGITIRGVGRHLGIAYMTAYQKFLWLARRAEKFHAQSRHNCREILFDDMESIEHTKLKPVSVALVVNENYQILSARVGTIPAKGRLAELSQKKYGPRENQREITMRKSLLEAKQLLKNTPDLIKSDAHPSYPILQQEVFPGILYERHSSREQKEKDRELIHRASSKRAFDPLFALNQRCAKLRADIRRLTRRSWCTTKRLAHLELHLQLYIAANNGYPILKNSV